MSDIIKVQIGKIGRGLIDLDMPEGSTIGEAIKISGYHFSDETRIKLSRDPDTGRGGGERCGNRSISHVRPGPSPTTPSYWQG